MLLTCTIREAVCDAEVGNQLFSFLLYVFQIYKIQHKMRVVTSVISPLTLRMEFKITNIQK